MVGGLGTKLQCERRDPGMHHDLRTPELPEGRTMHKTNKTGGVLTKTRTFVLAVYFLDDAKL